MASRADELRKQATECDRRAEESFQRCDTDGFLSQWANTITAQEKRKQADIEENGGVWEFPALFDLVGNRVRAKLATVPDRFNYGRPKQVWMFTDKHDKPTGLFINPFPVHTTTMAKKGYREGRETAPARAKVCGGGYGLSGCATCFVAVIRADKGYPEDALVV